MQTVEAASDIGVAGYGACAPELKENLQPCEQTVDAATEVVTAGCALCASECNDKTCNELEEPLSTSENITYTAKGSAEIGDVTSGVHASKVEPSAKYPRPTLDIPPIKV